MSEETFRVGRRSFLVGGAAAGAVNAAVAAIHDEDLERAPTCPASLRRLFDGGA
ncbi:MAG: hypothetical protein WDN46_22655 [Methylocella sp.]